MTFMIFEHRRLIDEFLDEDSIVSGRASLFLKGDITLANFPIEYYGEEYDHLDFLKWLGPSEGVEYEGFMGLRHATQDRAIGDIVNGYIRGESTLQEFDEVFSEQRLGVIGRGFIQYVKDKDRMRGIFKEWGLNEYGEK